MKELADINVVNLLVALVIAISGMFFHYYKMWASGQTRSTLRNYLFGKKALKSTLAAVFAVIGTVFTMYIASMISIDTLNGLLAIFTLGYTCDSLINRDPLSVKAK